MASTPTTVVDIWPVLLPVVIGGTLTLFGGLLGPLMSQHLVERRARKERRAQLFESMISAVYEHDHWLDMQRRRFTLDEAVELGASPMNKVQTVALIHFKELVRPMRALDLKSSEYLAWMSNASVERVNSNNAHIREGFVEVYEGWIQEREKFLEAAVKYASDRDGEL